LTAVIPCDGQVFPAKGILGGHDGTLGESWRIGADGKRTRLPNITTVTIRPGEWLHGLDTSGGGYGDPCERDPQKVLHDVRELWETPQRARDVYGVVLTGDAERGYALDMAATAARRAELRKGAAH
ncbi:MAG: hydantoinase B/oxoprolinase family protein, partial [Hyphomicrobiales bacterium]